VTAEALKKTALKFSAHDSKPKKAPKRAAPKKKVASDSDEDMFAVTKKKVCWTLCHLASLLTVHRRQGLSCIDCSGEVQFRLKLLECSVHSSWSTGLQKLF
jgi:hypothetical protein